MTDGIGARLVATSLAFALFLSAARNAPAQQVADLEFDVSVAAPALTGRTPRIGIDEGHANCHTLSGRYAPLGRLLRNDGFAVSEHTGAFSPASLAAFDAMIIANAGPAGSSDSRRSAAPAFTDDEVRVLEQWVREGGALLLAADHAPYGAAASALASQFGVEFGGGWVTDSAHAVPGEAGSVLSFSQPLLGNHPIIQGRYASEQIRTGPSATGAALFEEPTGWPRVDRGIYELRRRLEQAQTEEQFQAVGLLCRETLTSVAQVVYDPQRHVPTDGVVPSGTDAKRMLDSYIAVELAGGPNEGVRRHAKAALTLANDLQHHRTADYRQAALCAEATTSVVNLMAIISGRRDRAQ